MNGLDHPDPADPDPGGRQHPDASTDEHTSIETLQTDIITLAARARTINPVFSSVSAKRIFEMNGEVLITTADWVFCLPKKGRPTVRGNVLRRLGMGLKPREPGDAPSCSIETLLAFAKSKNRSDPELALIAATILGDIHTAFLELVIQAEAEVERRKLSTTLTPVNAGDAAQPPPPPQH
jgi:hypothetical protein